MDTLKRKIHPPSNPTLAAVSCPHPSAMSITQLRIELFHRIEAVDSDGDLKTSLARPLKRPKASELSKEDSIPALQRQVSECIQSTEAKFYTAKLKYTSNYNSFLHGEGTRKRRVRFIEMVEIMEIPSHRDYSMEIRNSIWTGLREIKANAKRNELEVQEEKERFDLGRICTKNDQLKKPEASLRRVAKVSSFREITRRGDTRSSPKKCRRRRLSTKLLKII
jgi:hypothetical protein